MPLFLDSVSVVGQKPKVKKNAILTSQNIFHNLMSTLINTFNVFLFDRVLVRSTRFQYRPLHKKVKLMPNEISNQDQDTLECLF